MKTIVNYAQKVKEQHALNKTLAPVETDLTSASKAYAVGQKFIHDGVLYQAKTAIAQGAALVLNTNYEAADDVSTEIEALTNNLNDEVETRAKVGAKNLLPNIASSGSYASSGTVTKNANGSLTINGTFDAVTTINIDYLNGLSNAVFDVTDLIGTDIAVSFLDTAVYGITLQVGYFNSAGTRSSLDSVSTKANITFPADAVKSATYLRIASGTYDNVTVYPMFRLATDTDPAYQPYAKTNQELTAENQTLTNEVDAIVNVYGSKNLMLPIPTRSANGVTFTSNPDKSVTITGTAENDGGIILQEIDLKAGSYILSRGNVSGTKPSFYLYDGTNIIAELGFNDVNSTEFTIATDKHLQVDSWMVQGSTYNVTFKPMLRDARIADSTYEPYSMTNQELTPIAQAVSNRNLLDNPWFTINQRGFTSGTVTADTYPLDRWKFSDNDSNLTVSSGTNGLSIVGTPTNAGENLIRQAIEYDRIPNSVGKVITLSVMLADGTVYKSSHVLVSPTSSWQLQASVDCDTFQVHLLTEGTTPSAFQLYLKSTDKAINATIRAIKLELGSVSTLAQDTAPNYQQELAKCQRYFVRLAPNSSDQYGVIGQGIMYSDTLAWIPLNMPVAMRAKPSISYNLDSGKIKITGKGLTAASGKAVTAITVNDRQPMQLLYFTCTSQSDLSAGDAVLIWFVGTTDAYIDLSADL